MNNGNSNNMDEDEDFVRQLNLLVSLYLASKGHKSVVDELTKDLESLDLLPSTYNWAGERLPASFNSIVISISDVQTLNIFRDLC